MSFKHILVCAMRAKCIDRGENHFSYYLVIECYQFQSDLLVSIIGFPFATELSKWKVIDAQNLMKTGFYFTISFKIQKQFIYNILLSAIIFIWFSPWHRYFIYGRHKAIHFILQVICDGESSSIHINFIYFCNQLKTLKSLHFNSSTPQLYFNWK